MVSFESFLSKVPLIEDAKNYWFFRTMGGRLFSPFLYKSIIAIDYARIKEDKVNELIKGGSKRGKRQIHSK